VVKGCISTLVRRRVWCIHRLGKRDGGASTDLRWGMHINSGEVGEGGGCNKAPIDW